MVYDDANTLFGTICRALFETCGSNDDARGATMTIYARNMKKNILNDDWRSLLPENADSKRFLKSSSDFYII